jgi:two-component system, cell cycle sensor histidine kinase and response regulator CckA
VGGTLATWDGEHLWAMVGPPLAAAASDLLAVVDRGGMIRYINRGAAGRSAAELVGTRLYEHAPAALRDELTASLAGVLGGAGEWQRELPLTVAGGQRRWYAVQANALCVDGAVVGATVAARDITDRHRAQAALRESEERYRTIFEHAPEAIVVFDVDRVAFVDVNHRACALFGLPRAELLAETPITLSPPHQPCGRASTTLAWAHLAEALGGAAPEFEWVHRTPGGAHLECVVRLVRLPESGRRLVRGSITDVTIQRRLEEHLRQWQKLEAMGQLAGGIAHDFNNVLAVVGASAGMMAEAVATDHPLMPGLAAIREAVRHGATLTRQLLAYARNAEGAAQPIDLNTVVRDANAWLARLVGARITLVERLNDAGTPVIADRNAIVQLLVNLVVNARDAMPAGGTITISTDRLAAWHAGGDSPCAVAGPVVRLRVEDTGPGMDERTRRRIFEPFYSTKPAGTGSGLGLSIVAGVVRQARGCIEVLSDVGAGTRFDIILPADTAADRRE